MDMTSEPTRLIGYITTAITATIGVLLAFGLNLSDPQQNAILATIGPYVVLAIGMVEFIRSRVVSPASAGEAVAIAKQIDPANNVIPEVKVAGFKAAVVESMPLIADERDIRWQPKVANA